MRLMRKIQLALMPVKIEFDRSDELDEIERILEALPGMRKVYQRVLADLGESSTGPGGLTAEQVVKLGVLRKRHDMTYRELAHATSDSLSMRRFLGLTLGQVLSKSCIHENVKRVKDATWVLLNDRLKEYALREGIEDGEIVRADTTTTETNIHFPTDASLLNDAIRILCRCMREAQSVVGKKRVVYIDHRRRSKKKLYRINNSRGESARHPEYLELMRITKKTLQDASEVLSVLKTTLVTSAEDVVRLTRCKKELETYIPSGKKALEQARRRIVHKEKVPAVEKLVSLFEPHTDVIVKGQRDVVFGHKVSIVTGASGLLLSVSVLDGNPADSNLVPKILDAHKASFGEAPKAMAFDGGFASTANRDLLKDEGVKELTFSKNGNMTLKSLVSSRAMHRWLMKFRAGIEGCISFLKRVFGFDRIYDKGLSSFKAAVQCATVACNLTLLARFRIAART